MTPVLDAQSMLAVALEQARKSLGEGGIPVGGAIFRTDGTLVGAGHNRLIQHGDPSMPGETDAFRAAGGLSRTLRAFHFFMFPSISSWPSFS